MAIENGFLTTRAVLVTCNETVMRVGLINFLKEMEQLAITMDEVSEANCMGDDCEGECHDAVADMMMDPWEITDKIFQYVTFGRMVETEDSEEEKGLSEDEIDRKVKFFRDILNRIDPAPNEKREDGIDDAEA